MHSIAQQIFTNTIRTAQIHRERGKYTIGSQMTRFVEVFLGSGGGGREMILSYTRITNLTLQTILSLSTGNHFSLPSRHLISLIRVESHSMRQIINSAVYFTVLQSCCVQCKSLKYI